MRVVNFGYIFFPIFKIAKNNQMIFYDRALIFRLAQAQWFLTDTELFLWGKKLEENFYIKHMFGIAWL